jgi:hypothetical protein
MRPGPFLYIPTGRISLQQPDRIVERVFESLELQYTSVKKPMWQTAGESDLLL